LQKNKSFLPRLPIRHSHGVEKDFQRSMTIAQVKRPSTAFYAKTFVVLLFFLPAACRANGDL
jgi:hypothetical protein